MRKTLLFILFAVLLFALFYKSPFSALYNFNKAKTLYEQKDYDKSLSYFERSLFADDKNVLSRFYYVLALSKSKPTYSVQKNLYQIANSNLEDEATRFAKTQAIALRAKLIQGFENNYIYNATMGNDILRWDIKTFPLKIYFENKNEAPSYYYENIIQAFSLWASKTNFVKFEEINEIDNSNIVIKFKDYTTKNCSDIECKYVVAYTEPQIGKDKLLSKMILTFYKTNPRLNEFSQQEIFNTAIHEIGHTLGMMGHSDNPNDIMYTSKNNSNPLRKNSSRISTADLNTLILLYRLEPNISNTKNLTNETFYYAPLILGNDNIRILKKLDELKKYIKEYPNMPAGYINIASVYADLANFDYALNMLDKAEKLKSTPEEDYLIQYNRAIIYFNKQDHDNSLKYANMAKELRNDDNIQALIEDIEKFKTY